MRRFYAFFLCLVLCFSLFPRYAFAAANDEVPTVIWSGYLDNDYYGVLASAENRFDAAVVALGYNPALFSSEVRSKLSDVNQGGNFYKYATTFDEVSSAAEYPEWVPAYVSIGNIISDYWHFGTGFPPWKSRATNTLYTNALIDLRLVLSGEEVGGGGSSSHRWPEGDYYKIPISPSSFTGASIPNSTAGNFLRNLEYVYVNVDSYNALMSWASSTYGGGYSLWLMHRGARDNTVNRLFTLTKGYWLVSNYNYRYNCEVGFTHSGGQLDYDDSCILWWTAGSLRQLWYNSSSNGDGYWYPVYQMQKIDPTGFPVVHLPESEWPEPTTPVTPTAPELPEPATPTVETPVSPTVPAPVWPDITINIEPDPNPGTTPSGLDYTELLTRINDNLISIDSFARAINSNLNSLRSDLLAEFNGVIGSLRNIYNFLLTIDSVLETHCTHLRNKMEESAVFIANYMRTLIKWLADQLDFDDLTNVEAPDNSLLTTINEKLGGGTYEPNPIKDEQGYYQWLDDLWDRFLLGDNWQSSMGSISGSFNELKTRFPFSIPWDVVALFRLFVHDPVTPVFDLPLYFSSDGSTPVHVDLTPWDSVAAVVRPLVFVIFALKLALLSRDLLGGLGADKGGL